MMAAKSLVVTVIAALSVLTVACGMELSGSAFSGTEFTGTEFSGTEFPGAGSTMMAQPAASGALADDWGWS